MTALEAMQMTPEQKARVEIDRMLLESGWLVQDVKSVNLHVGQGVAIREFPLERGFGFADFQKLWNYCNVLRDDGMRRRRLLTTNIPRQPGLTD
jgi:hypothetical protein